MSSKRHAIVVATLSVLLTACAGPTLRYSGVITTSDVREVPTRKVALKDKVVIVTHVDWSEAGKQGGLHAVRWNWYEGEILIAERQRTLDFGKPPYRFSRSLPASDLGLGHYRVEVLVDGVRIDEQVFDVVAD